MFFETKNHHFLDISDIGHKEAQIQFSVAQVLASDDYMLTPRRPQKYLKNKGMTQQKKENSKRQTKDSMKNPYLTTTKGKQIAGLSKMKKKQCFQEKDTQDDSQTVKITHKQLSPRSTLRRKPSQRDANVIQSRSKDNTNKIQPCKKSRSRTKSITSVSSVRRISTNPIGSTCSTSFKIILSNGKNHSNSHLNKVRSQTIRGTPEQLKTKNENIIMNDYFGQQFNGEQAQKLMQTPQRKLPRERSISSNKKQQLNKRTKKVVNAYQKVTSKVKLSLKK